VLQQATPGTDRLKNERLYTMGYFKSSTVTVAEIYAAAKEVCSRLHVSLGGNVHDVWHVQPFPGTAALARKDYGHLVRWTLYMPAMPLDARLSRMEADTVMAYVTHELGHAVFTQYEAWDIARAEGLANLVNGLEDVRIELKLCTVGAALPGARELLSILTEHVTAKSIVNGWKPTAPDQLPFTLYQYGATDPATLGYVVPSMPDFAAVCTAGQLAFLADVMARLRNCANTHDVLDLARWIKSTLAANAPVNLPVNLPPPGTPGEAGEAGDDVSQIAQGDEPGEGDEAGDAAPGEGEGDAGEGEGEGAGEGEGEGDAGAAPGEGEGDAGEGAGAGQSDTVADAGTDKADDKPSEGAGLGGGWDDATDATQKPSEVDLSDMGERVSKRNGQDADAVARDNRGITDFLNTPASTPRKRRIPADAHRTARVAGLLATPARLRRDVTQAVRSPDLLDVEHFHSSGRFDRRAEGRAMAGQMNVYRRRQEATGQLAAVSLLVDLSDSMDGYRAEAAACLAVHLGDALVAAAVPFEVLGFTAKANDTVATDGIVVAKGFADSWHEGRDNAAGLSLCVKGGTAMLPGVKAATVRLKARPGVSRRILLVLTDGDDGYSVESNKAAIKAARADGVEVIGLGMFHDASKVFGAHHVHVTDMAAVAASGLRALVDVLREDGPRRRVA
jgi:hypothetical protein